MIQESTPGEVNMKRPNCSGGKILIALFMLAGPLPGSADISVEKNVVYGMYSGLALLMDVHLPVKPNGYGLIMIPGSGWEAPLGYNAEPIRSVSRSQYMSSRPKTRVIAQKGTPKLSRKSAFSTSSV